MTLPSSNISLNAVASEVKDPTNSNVSLNSLYKRFLAGNNTLNSQIGMSQFANKTASVSWIAGRASSSAVSVFKSVRATTASYPYYARLTNISYSNSPCVAITNDGNYMAIYNGTVALLQQINGGWSLVSSFTPNVGTIVSFGIAWDPSGVYLAIPGGVVNGTNETPVTVLKRTGTTLAALSIPTTYTISTTSSMFAGACRWSPDGGTLVSTPDFPSTATNGIYRYTRSGDTFTALSLLASGTAPGSNSSPGSLEYNPSGSTIFFSFQNSSGTDVLCAYAVSGTTWTRTTQTTANTSYTNAAQWSSNGATVMASNNAPYALFWSVSGSTFTKGSTIPSISSATVVGMVWSDTAFYAGTTTPSLAQLQGSGTSWSFAGVSTNGVSGAPDLLSASNKSSPGTT